MEITLTHKKQKMWPHGNLLGWTQICKQTGHSIISISKEEEEKKMKKNVWLIKTKLSDAIVQDGSI